MQITMFRTKQQSAAQEPFHESSIDKIKKKLFFEKYAALKMFANEKRMIQLCSRLRSLIIHKNYWHIAKTRRVAYEFIYG